jgi:hypothetical protein
MIPGDLTFVSVCVGETERVFVRRYVGRLAALIRAARNRLPSMIAASSTVQPGTGRWTELVAEAKAKDAARNWFLGDAALEIAPVGQDGAHNGSTANLELFADEIGVPFSSIREYRRVAEAWSPDRRLSGTSWTTHQVLAARPELIREGMSVSEASAAVAERITVVSSGQFSLHEQRANQLRPVSGPTAFEQSERGAAAGYSGPSPELVQVIEREKRSRERPGHLAAVPDVDTPTWVVEIGEPTCVPVVIREAKLEKIRAGMAVLGELIPELSLHERDVMLREWAHVEKKLHSVPPPTFEE